MFHKHLAGACLLLSAYSLTISFSSAQTLSGRVTDIETREPLPGANVAIAETGKGSWANALGNYLVSVPAEGVYTLTVSFVGYQPLTKSVTFPLQETLDFELTKDLLLNEGVMVYATRANEKTPMTFTEISNKEIKAQNLGQDMPMMVNWSPSVVTTSDAGAGIGYTGIRIRGSDPTRTNVTINGVPINDSESHGVFWINIPDLASSTNNIQIQRGVGASTNGAGAFGATINLQTSMPSVRGFAELNHSVGSFGTQRHNVTFNTGLLKDHWSFEGRLSKTLSNGYIDRASSNLQSYFLSAGFHGHRTIVKALAFAGREITYQAWWGTPEARLKNDHEGMLAVIANNGYTESQATNLLGSGRTFNHYLYDNQVDHYQQDHYQLHLSHTFNARWSANAALHYTYGRGYFEEHRNSDPLSTYGLTPLLIGDSTINTSEVIRRRWLDNHFYGITYGLSYAGTRWQATLGGGYNIYDASHFGELVWARFAANSRIRHKYYQSEALKTDFNSFLKANYQLTDKLNVYADLQVRTIGYKAHGTDHDKTPINVKVGYLFWNPKAGLSYTLSGTSSLYASYSVANREPVRSDFVDARDGNTPTPETLGNWELGYKITSHGFAAGANVYLMNYKNQLVLTGELNDVGSALRTNVDNSHRAGLELQTSLQLTPRLTWNANLTLSRNKIGTFTEVLYDYGPGFDEYHVIKNTFSNTDISFSPGIIAGSQLLYRPLVPLEVALLTKYVGRQYLDNTQAEARSIDAYLVNDIRLTYEWTPPWAERIGFSLLINNVLNTLYSTNGYTFGYFAGEHAVRENYYYPQATGNFLAAISIRF